MSPAFRERLMLAVTAVDDCRYCSYFHAKQALKSGVTQEEIGQLLSGDVDGCPEEENLAVIYAQHWAESDARPDPEAVRKLQQTYGVEKTEAIHLMLRMIRLGNLLGNSWDYLLYRVSFGKWLCNLNDYTDGATINEPHGATKTGLGQYQYTGLLLQKVVSAGSVRFTERGILGHTTLGMVNHYL